MPRSAAEADVRPPPLVSGDHLTRSEFERRYDAMPALKKAELIEGVVIVGSPLKDEHGRHDNLISVWLGSYAIHTPGVKASSNPTVRLDEDNEPQPDQVLRLLPEGGGRSRVDEDGHLAGAPELVVEVALSSASQDLHRKKEVYRRHGVLEYLVVVLDPPGVRWFRAEAGSFVEAALGRVLRSQVFPGLWLDARALLAEDGARVARTLERGLASKDHAAFRRDLRARMRQARRPR